MKGQASRCIRNGEGMSANQGDLPSFALNGPSAST
jgi:hypothetical protein